MTINNAVLTSFNGSPALSVDGGVWVPSVDLKPHIATARNARRELMWWCANRPESGHWAVARKEG